MFDAVRAASARRGLPSRTPSLEGGGLMSRGRRLQRAWIAAGMGVAGAVVGAVASAGTQGADVRVSTHDIITSDPFASPTPPPDVLQQNEPSIAVHPAN